MFYLVQLLLDIALSLVSFILAAMAALFTSFISLDGESTLYAFFALFTYTADAYEIFVYAGVFILLTICVFQLFKSMFGPLTESTESPVVLIVRTVFYMVIVCNAFTICSWMIDIATVPYSLLASLTPDTGIMDGLSNVFETSTSNEDVMLGTVGGIAMLTAGIQGMPFFALVSSSVTPLMTTLLVFFVGQLTSNFFKLMLEAIERYVILGLLTIVSPLCFATGASRATSNISKAFIKMYISQLIVMCFSIFFIQSFIYGFQNIAELSVGVTVGTSTVVSMPVIMSLLMLLAWLKLGQRVDNHMSALGLNVAQAGGMANDFIGGFGSHMAGRSASGKLGNAVTNAAHGTTFGKQGSPASPLVGLPSALSGKNTARMQAANTNPNASRVHSKAAERLGSMKNQSGKAFSARETQAMLAGKDEFAGKSVGETMKGMLGDKIPEGYTPTDNCRMGNGKMHGEFKDKDGNIVSFDAEQGSNGMLNLAAPGDKPLGVTSCEGENAFDLMAGNNSDLTNGMEKTEVEPQELTESYPQDVNGDSRLADDGSIVQPGDAGYDDASQPLHFDDDNNPIQPGEEGYDSASPLNADGDMVMPSTASEASDDTRFDTDGNGVQPGEAGYENAQEPTKWDNDGNAIQPGEEGYDSASMVAPDGNVYAAGAEVNDGEISGVEQSASNMARYDESGNMMKPGDEGYEQGSLSDANGNSSQITPGESVSAESISGGDIAERQNNSGEPAYEQSQSGTTGVLEADGNQPLVPSENGDQALLAQGGTSGFTADKDGDAVYNKSTGEFMPKGEAMTSDGKVKDEFAGQIANGADGSPATFAKTSQTEAGQAAGQAQSNGGVGLQSDNNGIKSFDAAGRESKDGNFVKTEDGALMSKSSFHAGEEKGSVAGFTKGEASDSKYKDLEMSKGGKVQTYNADGSQNVSGNGPLVKDAQNGQLMSASSFAQKNTGQVQGFTESQSNGSMDRLEKGSQGGLQKYNANGEKSATGDFYKSTDANGNQKLVSSNAYDTNKDGKTKTYSNGGTTAAHGSHVKDSNGEYYRLASMNGTNPTRYDANGNESAEGRYASVIDARGNNTLIEAVGKGGSGSFRTYNNAPTSLSFRSLDGAPAADIQSYTQQAGGGYIKGTSNNYNQLFEGSARGASNSGMNSDGSLRTYDKDNNGNYTLNRAGTGSYARTVNPNDKYGCNYTQLGNSGTYAPNLVSKSGFAVDSMSANGTASVNIDSSSFKSSYVGAGTYTTMMNGVSGKMYDVRQVDKSSMMNNSNASIVNISGRDMYYIPDAGQSFTTSNGYNNGQTFAGSSAQNLMNTYGINKFQKQTLPNGDTRSNSVYDAAVQTPHGIYAYNSNEKRTAMATKSGSAVYQQKATLITPIKPAGEAGVDFKETRDPMTGGKAYVLNDKLTYTTASGGIPTLAGPKAAEKSASAGPVYPTPSPRIDNRKITAEHINVSDRLKDGRFE